MQLKFTEPKKPIKPCSLIERRFFNLNQAADHYMHFFLLLPLRLQSLIWFLKSWVSRRKRSKRISRKKVFAKIFRVFFLSWEKLPKSFISERLAYINFPSFFRGLLVISEQKKQDESFTFTQRRLSPKQKDRKSMNKHIFFSWDRTE